MKKDDIRYQTYVNILKEELIPAFGCTEPIALAYAAAKARQILGALPDRVLLQVSGSIIKNVKSVIVPNTGHLKGMPAAAAAGIIAGDPDRELEVISQRPGPGAGSDFTGSGRENKRDPGLPGKCPDRCGAH